MNVKNLSKKMDDLEFLQRKKYIKIDFSPRFYLRYSVVIQPFFLKYYSQDLELLH